MIDFYFRDPVGLIVMAGMCPENELEHQFCDNATLEIGKANLKTQYHGKNGLTDYPAKPGESYRFNFASESWEFDATIATQLALTKRDQLLQAGPDRVNPMWWSSMSTADQTAVAEYRQALLDITNQTGYPINIEWPPVPSIFA